MSDRWKPVYNLSIKGLGEHRVQRPGPGMFGHVWQFCIDMFVPDRKKWSQ